MSLNNVEKIDGAVKVRRVLMSVSDKTGLDQLVPSLVSVNPDVRIYSTGGTYNALVDILSRVTGDPNRNLMSVTEYTGQPEMQGGLVKTLDFKIYLGLLSETYNDAHRQDLARMDADPIDMVVVNLYPFKQTVARPDVTPEKARSNIDIGGPCMVRASAKNFVRVVSVTDPSDYPMIMEELRQTSGYVSLRTRFELARKAFAHTAEYDGAIAKFLTERKFSEISKCYQVVEA